MAYDEDLADRLREQLSGEPVTEKRMFGGLGFLLAGHLTVSASGQGGLLVRVDPAAAEALLDEPGAAEFDMGGRGPMKGWLRISGPALDDDEVLRAWVTRSLDYVRALPAK